MKEDCETETSGEQAAIRRYKAYRCDHCGTEIEAPARYCWECEYEFGPLGGGPMEED